MDRSYIVHDEENIKGFFNEYRWLSNYHLCEIHFDGLIFPATENAYVYAKASNEHIFHNEMSLDENGVLTTWTDLVKKLTVCSPSVSKKIGKSIPLRDDWHTVKFDVMSAVVFDKFYRHLDLRENLLATGHKYIEETNSWKDRYWGVCDGTGQNMLGKIHMSLRAHWAIGYPQLLNKKQTKPLF